MTISAVLECNLGEVQAVLNRLRRPGKSLFRRKESTWLHHRGVDYQTGDIALGHASKRAANSCHLYGKRRQRKLLRDADPASKPLRNNFTQRARAAARRAPNCARLLSRACP